jgi:uncharacterized membrane protein
MTTLTTAPLPSRTKPTVGRRVGFVWVALSSLAIVAFALGSYGTGTIDALAEQQVGLAPHYSTLPGFFQVVLYIHIGFAAIALLVGPAQFATALRTRFTKVHRALGRVYIVAVLVAGTAGLVVAPVSEAGFVGFFGFGTLAVLWLVSAVKAYRAVRARDFQAHQAWMIRNFAMTYAAVTLRLWLGILVLVHLTIGLEPAQTFANAYAAVPFLAWLPNIVVAEIMIARRGLPGLRWTRSN